MHTLSAIVWIRNTFSQHNGMIYTIFGINRKMLENIIEDLLLIMIVSDYISIKLQKTKPKEIGITIFVSR